LPLSGNQSRDGPFETRIAGDAATGTAEEHDRDRQHEHRHDRDPGARTNTGRLDDPDAVGVSAHPAPLIALHVVLRAA
jgi:hypothetical protein